MDQLKQVIYAWNDWIVLPGLLIVLVILFVRRRSKSLALLVIGLSIYVSFNAVRRFGGGSELQAFYFWLLNLESLGILLSVLGGVWFFVEELRRNRRA